MVERLQRRARRRIYSSTVAELPTVEIITELGWEPFTSVEKPMSFLSSRNVLETTYLQSRTKNSWHT